MLRQILIISCVCAAWVSIAQAAPPTKDSATMILRVTANGKTVRYALNDSPAAKSLYAQLPLRIAVEDYSDNEKIFYPPKKLDTRDTPFASGDVWILAYYEPWGDVVLFFDRYRPARGLYQLGTVIDGQEHITGLTGTITLEAAAVDTSL